MVQIPDGAARVAALGVADKGLKLLRDAMGVGVTAREGWVRFSGEPNAVLAAEAALRELVTAADQGKAMPPSRVLEIIGRATERAEAAGGAAAAEQQHEGQKRRAGDNPQTRAGDSTRKSRSGGGAGGTGGPMRVYSRGRAIEPRSENQRAYLDAIQRHDMVFGVGPAGTGKTYLAVAAAVHILRQGAARKLLLVRPAVEAGEKLGFLPGDMEAKVNPYLRPLLDALQEMVDEATLRRFMLHDIVEVAPLAFMRGRTINDAVAVMDEAQNTTVAQMQMFLTRLGRGSKMVVTGDPTQTDLPHGETSGLPDAMARLDGVQGVSVVQLTAGDIVRHDLVQRVVDAYAKPAPLPGKAGDAQERAAWGTPQ